MKKRILLPLCFFLTTLVSFGSNSWVTDFEAAKKQAAEQNKDLFVDFTGSDWCGWCMKLKSEVFDKESFQKGIAEHFILVELDYPRDKSSQSEAIQQQNEALAKKFHIRGFPTVLLLDSDGQPYGQLGYRPGGPEKYLVEVNKLHTQKVHFKQAIKQANDLQGEKKAQALFAALKLISPQFAPFYSSIIQEIKTLDPKDTTGLVAEETLRKELNNFGRELTELLQTGKKEEALSFIDTFLQKDTLPAKVRTGIQLSKVSLLANFGKSDEALNLVDAIIKENDAKGIEKQQIMTAKIGIYINRNDFDAVESLSQEIIQVAPESPVAKDIERFLKQKLPQIRASREKQANPTAPSTQEK